MLDRLPVELLIHLVHVAAPIEYGKTTHAERRAFLKNICLVCKTLRTIAQPLLPEVFSAKRTPSEFAPLQTIDADGTAKGRHVKLLALHASERDEEGGGAAMIHLALRACPCVEDLRVRDCRQFELDWLSGLSHLRRFVIHRGELIAASSTLTVVEFSSRAGIFTSSLNSTPFFCAAQFPMLRALTVQLAAEQGANPLSLIDLPLANQLEAFVTDLHTVSRLSDDNLPALPSPARVQVQIFVDDTPNILSPFPFIPEHLAFSDSGFPGSSHAGIFPAVWSAKEYLADMVKNLSSLSSLRTLDLPDCFHPRAALHEAYVAPRAQLLRDCETKGIEILWSPKPDEDQLDLSSRFWRKIREEKARAVASANSRS
ncbi:hypothetical protein JCM6882_001822 [Rhodosporidiobolus microsporus]